MIRLPRFGCSLILLSYTIELKVVADILNLEGGRFAKWPNRSLDSIAFDFRIRRLTRQFFSSLSRHPCKQNTDHGEAGSGHLRAVQIGRCQRRPRRSDQQENLAGDHQRPKPTVKHNQRCVYLAHPVSISFFWFSSLPLCRKSHMTNR